MDIMMTMMATEIIMEEGITMGTQTTTMRGEEAMMTMMSMAMATVIMMSMGMAIVTMAMGISVRGEKVTTVTRMSINTAT